MRSRSLTDEQIEEINYLRESGKTIKYLQERYNCSKGTIERSLTVRKNQKAGESLTVTEMDLTSYEDQHNVILVQSGLNRYAHGIDKVKKAITLLDRVTGQSVEIDAQNIFKLAYEMMDIVDLYISQESLFKKGA